jgi:trimethylamine--corrinoid protein Co-methyltransferase
MAFSCLIAGQLRRVGHVASLVIGQLARRLKLPLRCSGAFTSSKVPDGQAMQERTMSMVAAV